MTVSAQKPWMATGPATPGAGSPERPNRILVVDDETQIRRAIKSILAARGYDVVLASSGEEAVQLAPEAPPDLTILDLSMPGINGLDVCRELRCWTQAPILVLSVHSEVEAKVAALDLGADDYVTKPFATGELLARVRALLRRQTPMPQSEPMIQVGNILIDVARRQVLKRGEEIRLTRTEFDILVCLASRAGCVVTSKMLLNAVWGPSTLDDTTSLRVHMGHLRKKIEAHPAVPTILLTEPGVGYRMVDR